MRYSVFYVSGRPRLAIPAGGYTLRTAAARVIQPVTARKAIFRGFLDFALRVGADSLLSRREDDPLAGAPEFDTLHLDAWIRQVGEEVGLPALYPVVVWPPQPTRERVYVHFLTPEGRSAAFAKLSAASREERLDSEATALARLPELELRRCRTPELFSSSVFDGHRYVLMEPLPRGEPVRSRWPELEPLVAEFAGEARLLRPGELESASWWKRALSRAEGFPHLIRDVRAVASRDGVWVRRVHGDFGHHNLLRARGEVWLFDWENWSECGPRLTDELGFWIGRNRKYIRRRARRAFEQFARRFLARDPKRRPEVAAALAYLVACEIGAATILARFWPAPEP